MLGQVAAHAKIDVEALRLLLLSGSNQGQAATVLGVHVRTVRHAVAREKAVHGPDWPVIRPRTPRQRQAAAAPEPAPARAPAALGPDATPDEIEAWQLAVFVAEVQDGGRDRIAAAKAAGEIADKRRARKPLADAGADPALAAAEIMRGIELATENAEKSTERT